MTAQEYQKLEQVLFYGIAQARISNAEIQEFENTSDEIEKHILELKLQNHRGVAEGIQYALVALKFQHCDMKILSKELD